MKTLIINGSPRKDGDTAKLTQILKQNLSGDIIEISAFYDDIRSCFDCRTCWEKEGCATPDDMQKIYDDSYDNVVIASPVYTSNLPGPIINIQSRFNFLYNNKKHLNFVPEHKNKIGAVILVAGGCKSPDIKEDTSLQTAKNILIRMHATLPDENIITYLSTDVAPAISDQTTIDKVTQLAKRLSFQEETIPLQEEFHEN